MHGQDDWQTLGFGSRGFREVTGHRGSHAVRLKIKAFHGWLSGFNRRESSAGVTVSTRHYGGMLHGFLHFAEPFDDGKRAVTELGQAIKAKLSK